MRGGEPVVVVLGGGPAGLGAVLALARAGTRPVLVEASPVLGGLCRTLRRGGYAYDLGGHIPFVRDDARREWMADLLGGRLRWVPRPVASVRGGRVLPGRYLDQRPAGPVAPVPDDGSAAGYLGALAGAEVRDRVMRRYLEKVDGVPLERITASRARKLDTEQRAPQGFWYPEGGIGVLMDAMGEAARRAGAEVLTGTRVRAVDAEGGRVRAVEVEGPDGRRTLPAAAVVMGIAPAVAARLVRPAPPPDALPVLPFRAVCLVALAVRRERCSAEPWIQVDDPAVPFARAAEFTNWSPGMAPAGHTVLGLECYCRAEGGDPVWALGDEALGAACARALAGPLGLLDDAGAARVLEVVRIGRAYPLIDVDRSTEAALPAAWLAGIEGVHLAQGGTIVTAIEAGERAAQAAPGAAVAA